MNRCPHSFVRAFTLIELLVVFVCVGMVALMFLPVLARSKARSAKIDCVNNIKQILLELRKALFASGVTNRLAIPASP
jgi:type II secretory pathway pseudopilin PulG